MKKNTYPEVFNVYQINYVNGCQALAFSETQAIEVGDRVLTAFGEGTVVYMVQFCTADEPWFKMISGIYTVDRITHKIVEVR